MRNIASAVIDLATQAEKFPNDLGGGASYLWCPDNPPAPYTGMKKQWVPNQTGWSTLSWEPTGFIYFHYYVYGYLSGSVSYFYVRAFSDLNGNGIPAYRQTQYQRDATGGWNIVDDVEWPQGES
jgi:hypothetical protein